MSPSADWRPAFRAISAANTGKVSELTTPVSLKRRATRSGSSAILSIAKVSSPNTRRNGLWMGAIKPARSTVCATISGATCLSSSSAVNKARSRPGFILSNDLGGNWISTPTTAGFTAASARMALPRCSCHIASGSSNTSSDASSMPINTGSTLAGRG